MVSCNDKPKVISTVAEPSSETSQGTGIFSGSEANIRGSISNAFHHVTVKEVLPTEKYVYLFVSEEGQDDYWIATGKKEVNEGEKYFYKDGLLKTNFESKEHNRIFDRVFLVGNLMPENHGGQNITQPVKSNSNAPISKVIKKVDGATKIAEIVKAPGAFEGKTVLLSGVCTKLNAGIMNRNWIHVQDGSMDKYDMVITSDIAIPEGHQVVMEGTVALNRDFGAGYTYDIIIENGVLVNN
jgi:hypothetical protein